MISFHTKRVAKIYKVFDKLIASLQISIDALTEKSDDIDELILSLELEQLNADIEVEKLKKLKNNIVRIAE